MKIQNFSKCHVGPKSYKNEHLKMANTLKLFEVEPSNFAFDLMLTVPFKWCRFLGAGSLLQWAVIAVVLYCSGPLLQLAFI